jgi:hypothetical protein
MTQLKTALEGWLLEKHRFSESPLMIIFKGTKCDYPFWQLVSSINANAERHQTYGANIFRGTQGVLMGTQGYSGVLRGIQGYSGVLRGIQGYSGVLKGTQGYSRVLRSTQLESL